jgi:SAM-dependent methyltransferase
LRENGHCTAWRGQYSADIDPITDPLPVWDQATLAFYTHEAPAYVAKSKVGASRWLADFITGLPTGARILELGCGSGRDAEALLAHGFEVDVTDGTPAIAAAAEMRLGRPVRTMRFDELSAVDAYDGIWANASLLHVPRTALCGILARVLCALKPGGLHFASYKVGTSAGRDILGRYYNYLDRNTVKHFYSQSGRWDTMAVTDYIARGYEGPPASWIAVTARKRPNNTCI